MTRFYKHHVTKDLISDERKKLVLRSAHILDHICEKCDIKHVPYVHNNKQCKGCEHYNELNEIGKKLLKVRGKRKC